MAGLFFFVVAGVQLQEFGGTSYDPRRPDFMDVAGGFPVLTGGAAGGCCTLVTSGTP